MITVVDYGLGNLGSILNMLKRLGISAQLTSDPLKIQHSDKLILPGVGAFDAGMENLHSRGLVESLNEVALVTRRPVLGICLGMQLLTRSSEEGSMPGLAWIPADTRGFRSESPGFDAKIPHMGWADVSVQRSSVLLKGLEHEARFYFVHSYFVLPDDPDTVLGSATYGFPFAAAIQKDNIAGVQFHPEKSHRFGMKIFENFSTL